MSISDTGVESTPIGQIVGTTDKKGNPNRLEFYTQSLLTDAATLTSQQLAEKWASRLVALETQRYEDPATGLKVKEAGEKILQHKIGLAQSSGQDLALLMLDLDGFKKVNDTQGHAAGDRAILLLANYLANKTSRETVACRYGGDEFFLIMPGSDPDAAMGLSERAVEELSELMRSNGFDVTTSIGISYLRDDTIDAKTMMREADQALLTAKVTGKNQFVVHLPEEVK